MPTLPTLAVVLALLVSRTALGTPLELAYTGQLTDPVGVPLVGPQNVRIRFFDGPTGGSPLAVTLLSGPYVSAGNPPPLSVAATYLADCTGYSSCLPVSLTTQGVFQVSLYLSPSDFHAVFPDSGSSKWIEVEAGSVSGTTFTADPTLVYPRQKFAVAPYCLKVPVDGSLVAYDSGGRITLGTSVPAFAKTALPTCLTGEVLKANGTSLSCVTDSTTDASVRAFAKTNLPTCLTGEVLKGNGTSLSCVTDSTTDASVRAFAKTNLPTCLTGQVLKGDGTSLSCVTDSTTDASVRTFAKTNLPSCTSGERLTGNGTSLSCVTTTASGPTGSGTTGTIARWTGTGSLGNSVMTESGSTVSLNGTLALPTTSATAGRITMGSLNMLHAYNFGTFVGFNAGNLTMIGSANTGVGNGALTNVGAGGNNTAVGAGAMSNTVTGTSNVAVGSFAMNQNTGGANNVAVGPDALRLSTGGVGNTAIGYNAMRSLTNTSSSTAVGASALWQSTGGSNTAIGASALSLNTTGGNNVAIGFAAGLQNTIGTNNTFVGHSAGASTGGLSNATAIGYNAQATQSNTLILGNGANVGIGTSAPTALLSVNGAANKTGGGSWTVFSDARLKNVERGFPYGLKEVLALEPVFYRYKRENALGLASDKSHSGFVAQAVRKVIPEAVEETPKGFLTLNQDPILWAMLNAIKEQQAELTALRKEVERLRAIAPGPTAPASPSAAR